LASFPIFIFPDNNLREVFWVRIYVEIFFPCLHRKSSF